MKQGSSLAGDSKIYDREKHDFYATSPQSVRDLLEIADITGEHFYEPCVGLGHIAEVLKEYFPKALVRGSDIVDRGYKDTVVLDFLKETPSFKTDWVITNPPFKHAREFISKSLDISHKGVAMFLKIQFLEGKARKEWFKTTPLKYVYVFSGRQDPMRDGLELNPDTGKKWGGTTCFAWFVWEHGYKGEPMVRWI